MAAGMLRLAVCWALGTCNLGQIHPIQQVSTVLVCIIPTSLSMHTQIGCDCAVNQMLWKAFVDIRAWLSHAAPGCCSMPPRAIIVSCCRLGTLDQQHAENEWALRAYMRSFKKAKLSEASED